MHGKIFLAVAIIALAFLIMLFVKYLKWNVNAEILLMGLALPFALMLVGLALSVFVGHNVLILRYLTPRHGCILASCCNVDWLVMQYESGRVVGILLFVIVLILCLKSYQFNYSQVKMYGQQFNQTLRVFKRIPRRADVIYNESTVMYSSSSYLKRNYVLGDCKNDVLFKTYHKVFDNIHNNNGLSVSHRRPVYFIKLKHTNKIDIYLSRESNAFMRKYGHYMSRVGRIYLPLDGGESVVYRISN